MPPSERPRIWRSRTREPWPRSFRLAITAILLTLAVALAVDVASGMRKQRRRNEVRVTIQRMSGLGDAFEAAAARSRAGCVHRAAEFFGTAGAAPALPREALVDAWGSEIGFVASGHRYIVFSLGSDRLADRERPGGGVESDAADLVYSNREWLQYPSGVATVSDPPLTPADAFAEIAACAGQVR